MQPVTNELLNAFDCDEVAVLNSGLSSFYDIIYTGELFLEGFATAKDIALTGIINVAEEIINFFTNLAEDK